MRPNRDDDFAGLLEAIDRGIHASEVMPFSHPWTDAPPELRRRNSVQHWWANRANWSPEDWHLEFVVVSDDRPVGIQELFARDFPVLREVATGSWLSGPYQGLGFGKEMRTAVLHFAFECLGAVLARSGAFVDNAPSVAVSRALGYRENGFYRQAPRGSPKDAVSFELTREEWSTRRRSLAPVETSGVQRALEMFSAH